MDPESIATWMQAELERDNCLYQDDVVDYLEKNGYHELLKENSDGNIVLGLKVLNAFKKLNSESVVWVKPDRYWRPRVPEDESSREARG